jgi:hypothetical protein
MYIYKRIAVLIAMIMVLSACQPKKEADLAIEIALAVAMTQTAVAQDAQLPEIEPTATPTPMETAFDLQPLSPDECGQLLDTLETV